MEDKSIMIQTDTQGYLNVCLSHEDVTHLPDGRVPLRNLVKALQEYLGQYGGEGNLKICMYYKDTDGEIKPLNPDSLSKLSGE